MDYKDFSIYSIVDREKCAARFKGLSADEVKRAQKQREKLELCAAHLNMYIAGCQNAQQQALQGVHRALLSLINDFSFEPDKRDVEIIKKVRALMINRTLFEDVEARYIADCATLCQKIERRQFAVLKINDGYKLNKNEKIERRNRIHAEKQEQLLVQTKADIKKHKQAIASLNEAMRQKKLEIASTMEESASVLLLRELKAMQYKEEQERSLLAQNERIVRMIETERYQQSMNKLLDAVDIKRGAQLIKEAKRLQERQRMVESMAQMAEQQVDKLSSAPIKIDELSEIRAIRAAAQKTPPVRVTPTRSQAHTAQSQSSEAIDEELIIDPI